MPLNIIVVFICPHEMSCENKSHDNDPTLTPYDIPMHRIKDDT